LECLFIAQEKARKKQLQYIIVSETIQNYLLECNENQNITKLDPKCDDLKKYYNAQNKFGIIE